MSCGVSLPQGFCVQEKIKRVVLSPSKLGAFRLCNMQLSSEGGMHGLARV